MSSYDDHDDPFEIEPEAHARRRDPDTSRAAAARLSDQSSMMRALLRTYLDGEHTCEEAAHAAGYQHERSTKRVSDLLRRGFIADTGARRAGSSGREQMVCRITTTGRGALMRAAR